MNADLPYRRSKVAAKAAFQGRRAQTVWIALAGNIVVAIAKLVAGLMTGSAAMMAEAAHSFASINEMLLAPDLNAAVYHRASSRWTISDG